MFKRLLIKSETKKWTDQNIINQEQSEKIMELYEQDKKSLVSIIAIMGSILVGAGILLFVASNWSALSWPVKLILIFSLISLIYLSAYKLQNSYPKVSASIAGIGAFAFGAAIWLIAQTFNFPIDTKLAYFLWFAGLVAPFWLLKNKLTGIVSIFSLIISSFIGGLSTYLEITIFIFLITVIFFMFAYKESSYVFYHLSFLSYIYSGCYITYKLLPLNDEFYFLFPVVVFGILFLTLYKFAENKVLKNSLLSTSVLSILFSSYFFSFSEVFTIKETDLYNIIMSIVIISLTIIAIFIGNRISPYLRNYLTIISVFSLIILWLNHENSLLLISNANLFLQNLVLITVAYQLRNVFLFNLGIFSFGLSVIIKYFDYFYDMLPRSFFFIIMGLLLVGLSIILEKNRKKYIERMEDNYE